MLKTLLPGAYDELRAFDTPLAAAMVAALSQDPSQVDRETQHQVVYMSFADATADTRNYGKPITPVTVYDGLSVTSSSPLCGAFAACACACAGCLAHTWGCCAERVCDASLANPGFSSVPPNLVLGMDFYSSTATTDSYVYFVESGSLNQSCGSQRGVRVARCSVGTESDLCVCSLPRGPMLW